MRDLSRFTVDGLDLPDESRNLTTLYGLSDFWIYLFSDQSLHHLWQSATAVEASEIYNKFLQQVAGFGLQTVIEQTGHQIKLELLPASGNSLTFTLPENVKSVRYLANSPLSPSILLEEGVDFELDLSNNTITFAKSLASYGFPINYTSAGNTFAVWFVDARIDDGALQSLASLLGVKTTNPLVTYKDFLQGVGFLYTNGPTVGLIRYGLSLCLGIPTARATESVIAIQTDISTGNYVVVTNLNSYLIPYGLKPSVAVGQSLSLFESLSDWVQVDDVETNPDWWFLIQIPQNLIVNPPLPTDGTDPSLQRYAKPGNYADWIMRNYLSRHTFLVNVVTTSFENIQVFEPIFDLIHYVKPTHTAMIYLWSVPNTETVVMTDILSMKGSAQLCEKLSNDLENFRRDSLQPIGRGICNGHTRFEFPLRYQTLFSAPNLLGGAIPDSVPALGLPFEGTSVITHFNAIEAQFGMLETVSTTNILLYSNDFSNATWTGSRTITPGQLSYDGTLSAVTYYGTIQQPVTVQPYTNYTLSVYMKGNRTVILFFGNYGCVVDLTTGTIGNYIGGTQFAYSSAQPNGWYRIFLTIPIQENTSSLVVTLTSEPYTPTTVTVDSTSITFDSVQTTMDGLYQPLTVTADMTTITSDTTGVTADGYYANSASLHQISITDAQVETGTNGTTYIETHGTPVTLTDNGPVEVLDPIDLATINAPLPSLVSKVRGSGLILANWLKNLFNRGAGNYMTRRDNMTFGRGIQCSGYSDAFPVSIPGFKPVYMYTTSTADLKAKLSTLKMPLPTANEWFLIVNGQGTFSSLSINSQPIDTIGDIGLLSGLYLKANYATLFQRGQGVALPQMFPAASYKTYAPNLSSIQDSDFLIFVQVTSEAWGAFWATTEVSSTEPGWPYAGVGSYNDATILKQGQPTRGCGPSFRSGFYATRGLYPLNNSTVAVAPINLPVIDSTNPPLQATGAPVTSLGIVNGSAVDVGYNVVTPVTTETLPVVKYTDQYNLNVPLTRGGFNLTESTLV